MDAIDSSVLIADIVATERSHGACERLLNSGPHAIYAHGLSETFSTLTGGRLQPRLLASDAALLIVSSIDHGVTVLELPFRVQLKAYEEAEARGGRGGAIFDYLHLAAARYFQIQRFYTLNMGDFEHFWRKGDPEIVHP